MLCFAKLELFRIADVIHRGSTQAHIEWVRTTVKHDDLIHWYNLRVPGHMLEDRNEYLSSTIHTSFNEFRVAIRLASLDGEFHISDYTDNPVHMNPCMMLTVAAIVDLRMMELWLDSLFTEIEHGFSHVCIRNLWQYILLKLISD